MSGLTESCTIINGKTCIVEKAYEGENNYSVQLEAGREYLVSALGEVNNPEASFQIRKVKKT